MNEEVRNYLRVSEYNAYIKSLLDNDDLLRNVYVLGEVTDLSPRGEHLFFSLKDENTKMSVVCLGYKRFYQPRTGETVLVMGYPDYFEKGGKLNFNAYNIEAVGIGKLHQELEKIKEKLSYLGYFDQELKKPIPKFCQKVCILTSADGAVFYDIFQSIRNVNDIIDITLVDVRVQGANAEKSIIKNLIEVDKMGFDVIILARGGGSFEDLLPFSAEELVKTIFSLNTPLISAVGHETDNPLCDFVADKRAITPTEAGKMVAYDTEALKQEIYDYACVFSNKVERNFSRYYNRILSIAKRISLKSQLSLNQQTNKLQKKLRFMQDNVNNRFNQIDHVIQSKINILDNLNPSKILSKGYFGLTKDEDKVSKISSLNIGDEVKIIGNDAIATAKVTKKEKL